jgi:hypothetical protein
VLIGERFLAPVRASLGDTAFDAEQTSGRRLGIDDVLALAATPGRPAVAETVTSPVPPT